MLKIFWTPSVFTKSCCWSVVVESQNQSTYLLSSLSWCGFQRDLFHCLLLTIQGFQGNKASSKMLGVCHFNSSNSVRLITYLICKHTHTHTDMVKTCSERWVDYNEPHYSYFAKHTVIERRGSFADVLVWEAVCLIQVVSLPYLKDDRRFQHDLCCWF